MALIMASTLIPAYVFGWGSRGENAGGYDYFTVTFSVQGEGGSLIATVFAPDVENVNNTPPPSQNLEYVTRMMLTL